MIRLLAITIGCLGLVACSSQQTTEPPKKEYRIARQQLPPEPTYAPLRWVHLPETHPAEHFNPESHRPEPRPLLLPVVHFSIKDKPLCDAAIMLAGLGRYSSYCSSQLREKRITLNALGTMDELARQIEQEHKIEVVVDHAHREVRFLTGINVEERFFGEDVEG